MNKIKTIVDTIIGQSVNPRSIVLCLGAGVSVHAGTPTFNEIVAQLGEIKNYQNEFSRNNPEAFYEYASETIGRHNVINAIAGLNKGINPTELHFALAESPINIFITTNFDILLEKAMQESGNEFDVVTSDSRLLKSEKRKTIVKLSGTIDRPDTLVLTRLDQKTITKSRTELQSFVRAHLANSLVLFMGYSLKDGLSDFYEKFGLESNILNNWIVIADKINTLDESIWKGRGVRLFEIKREMLTSFVNELSLRISQYEKRKPISKNKRKIFIGGGIKNTRLVKRIEKSLIEAGLSTILLRDEPSEGRTLSEKFSSSVQEADAAIVIFDDDDKFVHNIRGANANLFFELGYLVSTLGRENVMVIQSTQQNLPTAFVGSEIILYDPDKLNLISQQLDNWISRL